ncbi:MAG: hypothetical protein C0184_16850 [Chloroflexus aggregans]|uniref:DUF4440 domain-containing protein n=1 Tax=Chloroflexus aggregans TaxID=152260 RepID=A0A2J6WR69_9CHLR|nr:MAG: hypothetical protein C0184_16850 [Chloroflexus aggregans]
MDQYPMPIQSSSFGCSRVLLIIAITGGIALVSCCGLLAFSGWQLFNYSRTDLAAIKQVVIDFIDAGRRNDTAAALAIFADSTQTRVTRRDLEQLFANRRLFREVQDVSITSFNFTVNLVEGESAEIGGSIMYTDGSSQAFTARLHKENDQWRLIRIDFR